MSAMSKKPFHFSEVSAKKKCFVCGKPLKLNLLAKVPKAEHCFKHWKRHLAIKIDMKATEKERLAKGLPIY